MRVLRQIEQFEAQKPLFLALGNFDGVHSGHQQILKRACEDARRHGGLAAVMTFSEHPQTVLTGKPGPHLLYSIEQKIFFLKQAGVDICLLLSFTESFSKLEAEEFAAKILVEQLKVRKVYLGTEARFGHGRKGDASLMKKLAGKHGFDFEAVPPVTVEEKPVSSSRIRTLVEAGEFQKASGLLGRPFSMFLKVVRGDGRGAGLGFPTANFDTEGRVMPPLGVYPVALRPVEGDNPEAWSLGKVWHQAAANCGNRPTFHPGSKQVVLEAFILDYPGGELYGRVFEVLFYPRLRGEKAFSGIEELKAQIGTDIEAVKARFAKNPPSKAGENAVIS